MDEKGEWAVSFVRIDSLSKKYDQHWVLRDISLEIEEGEMITLLGPSGCGKSTLLRVIAGLTDMEVGGSIEIGGQEISGKAPKDRNVGMVFQSYALFPNMNVYENVAFGLKMNRVERNQIEEKVLRMLNIVDLLDKKDAYPSQLSGGQQQRVALARSLVVEPRLLLLDEPLSALDAKIRKNLQSELRRIQQDLNMTTIFVTHDQEEALTLSDRVVVMNQGQIIQSGCPKEIYTHPKTEFVARFIGHYNVVEPHDLAIDGSNLIAIRPEVIRILSDEILKDFNGYTVPGMVRELTLKGNFWRIEVQAGTNTWWVDSMNHQLGPEVSKGMSVKLGIPKEECVALEG